MSISKQEEFKGYVFRAKDIFWSTQEEIRETMQQLKQGCQQEVKRNKHQVARSN